MLSQPQQDSKQLRHNKQPHYHISFQCKMWSSPSYTLQINHMQETVTPPPPPPKQKCFWQSNVGTVQVYIHLMSQNALTCSINRLTNNLLILFGQKCWWRGHCLEMKNPATLSLLHLPPKERTQRKENWQHKETELITLHSKILYVPSNSLGTAKYSLSLVIHLAQQNTLCA